MAPGATKPYQPPEAPAGKINLTDPDSRLVKATRGWIQGYNAQAAVGEEQIVLAAELTIDSPDFAHLEPMVEATEAELAKAGVDEKPEVALADAGYGGPSSRHASPLPIPALSLRASPQEASGSVSGTRARPTYRWKQRRLLSKADWRSTVNPCQRSP